MFIKEYFQLLVPWLLIAWLIFSLCSWTGLAQIHKAWQKLAVLALAAIMALVPFLGLSLADYLLSLNPNFSIGSLALVGVLLWPKIAGRPLLSESSLRVFCLWNAGFSLVLFSSCLGLIPYDLYALGYHFSPWFAVMALTTLVAVWVWSPLSFIFIAYIAAFDLQLLPSPNFFDYLTDGFLLFMSSGLLLFRARPWSTEIQGSPGPPRGAEFSQAGKGSALI